MDGKNVLAHNYTHNVVLFRRMFPSLQFSIVGLNPALRYRIFIDFVNIDSKRYRYSFHQSAWTVTGPGMGGASADE